MKQGDLNAQSGIGGYKNLTFKGKMIGMKRGSDSRKQDIIE